jgi:hypothetical protein
MFIQLFSGPSCARSLLILHDPKPAIVSRLCERIAELAAGRLSSIAVHHLPGFLSVSDCRLFFSVGTQDMGVRRLPHAIHTFECELQPESWDKVHGLVTPFIDRTYWEMFE